MTLLDKAKVNQPYNRTGPSSEEIELAIAWLTGEVGTTQVRRAMGYKPHNNSAVYSFLTTRFKEAYRQGRLEVKKNNGR